MEIKLASSILSEPRPDNLHYGGPLLSGCHAPQYITVSLKNFELSASKEAESFCFVLDKIIVQVKNICWEDKSNYLGIVGKAFLQPRDFFDVPCKSSILQIFRVSKQKISSLKFWPLLVISFQMSFQWCKSLTLSCIQFSIHSYKVHSVGQSYNSLLMF